MEKEVKVKLLGSIRDGLLMPTAYLDAEADHPNALRIRYLVGLAFQLENKRLLDRYMK